MIPTATDFDRAATTLSALRRRGKTRAGGGLPDGLILAMAARVSRLGTFLREVARERDAMAGR